jgi:hypothetical protein
MNDVIGFCTWMCAGNDNNGDNDDDDDDDDDDDESSSRDDALVSTAAAAAASPAAERVVPSFSIRMSFSGMLNRPRSTRIWLKMARGDGDDTHFTCCGVHSAENRP